MNKKTQEAMFSSKADNWATPQDLFDKLNAQYGPFELDVCANSDNAKCEDYLSLEEKKQNGLEIAWWSLVDKCWRKPPYGREIGKWVKKAYEESTRGCLVVCLLPARTDTKWFHDFIYKNSRATCEFIRGRLKFGEAKNSAPFPSMIVVFNPPK